jgi:hypothetical protein
MNSIVFHCLSKLLKPLLRLDICVKETIHIGIGSNQHDVVPSIMALFVRDVLVQTSTLLDEY